MPSPVTVLLLNTLPFAGATVTTKPWLEDPVMRLPIEVFVVPALIVMPSPSAVSMPLSRISFPVIVQPAVPVFR